MARKTRTFDRKRYYLWNVSRRRSDLAKQAEKLRRGGLLARVVSVPNKYAPKDVNYELYVHGSLLNLVGRS